MISVGAINLGRKVTRWPANTAADIEEVLTSLEAGLPCEGRRRFAPAGTP
ncbi:hypothetical protein [Bradyrhizobium cenepequi]|nr:hypothetical protein [Bradyrhizobium cenepequi]MCA6111637.1 hypothetical protein [Bradyrhizobium cenepequi]